MTRRNPEAEELRRVLPRMIDSLPQKKRFLAATVFYNWEKIVGERIARHVKPVRVDFRVLELTADTPTWAHELDCMKIEIIKRVNAFASAELVTEVKFVPWSSRHQIKFKVGQADGAPRERRIRPPTETELSRAESFCRRVRSPELRARMASAMAQAWVKREQLRTASQD